MRMIFANALDLARPALGKKLLQLNWPFLLLITAITGIGVALNRGNATETSREGAH